MAGSTAAMTTKGAVPDARLHRPPHAPDDPDAVRDHAVVLRHRAVRARRAGRAHHRAAAGHRRRRDRARLGRRRRPRRRRRRSGPAAARRDARPRAIAARRGSTRSSSSQLEQQFGFDKPAHERFAKMLWDYARFDFGKSYFRDVSVLQLIKEKLPVSITLGLWMTLLSYAISIPLGIRKAVRDGSRLRRLDLRRGHRRLRHPGLPVRDPAHRALRRRLVLADLPAARPVVGQLERALALGEDRRLPLAHRAADRGDGARRLRDLDAARPRTRSSTRSASNTSSPRA